MLSSFPQEKLHIVLGRLGRANAGIQLPGNNDAELTSIRAPCVFRSDEEELHKYAAILAATEPFRLLCNAQIKNTMNPIAQFLHWLSGIVISVIFNFSSNAAHIHR